MCQISDQIKLCTCGSVKGLKSNIWYLSRYYQNEIILVGEVVGGFFDRSESYQQRHAALEEVLNQRNRFDQDLRIEDADYLKIKLPGVDSDEVETFEFQYEEGKWRKTIMDPFAFDHFRLEARGTVEPE